MANSDRVTILDVAARAGVHAGTVSRALSHPEKVAEATRERIQEAVRELGFVPNKAARRLITGRTGNVGVVVPDITNPFFGSFVRSIEHAARANDLQVLLVDTGEDRVEEVKAAESLSRDVDGLIMVSPRQLHEELAVVGDTPVVFVNRPVPGHASVLLRSARAAGDALRHLASLGHREIAYLGGPSGAWSAEERSNAVRRTAKSAGVSITDIPVAGPTFEAAVEAVDALTATGATAVISFNDQVALGVMAGLTARGVSVPGDISLIGCDDVPMAAMVSPPLTTISLPIADAGTAAVGVMGTQDVIELAGSLVVRGSTGPAAISAP